MFKGFRKEAINVHPRHHKGIEHKRQQIIDSIDAWLAKSRGEPVKRVSRLSKIEGDTRFVWLKYSRQNVPLNAAGDLVGEIPAGQNEAAFWDWMKEQVRAGAYDTGIEQIAAATHRRMRAGMHKMPEAGSDPEK